MNPFATRNEWSCPRKAFLDVDDVYAVSSTLRELSLYLEYRAACLLRNEVVSPLGDLYPDDTRNRDFVPPG